MPALDPAPFLRGNPFPSTPTVAYPRALAADAARLPAGTWYTATIPAGVRLELRGDADSVVVAYRTETDDVGPRSHAAGRNFEVWVADTRVASARAVLGEGAAELPLSLSETDTAVVYLPEYLRPTVLAVTPVGGAVVPAPRGARWLAYGDSIVEGWVASSPGSSWPSRLARRLGLEVCNLGYAGTARGELPSADHIAATPAELVTISYGTNCWSTIPHTAALLAAGVDAFLTLVRLGHPDTPIVLTTPIPRPDAETTPNRVGATLQDLRTAMGSVVRERIDRGDGHLTLVDGETLVEAGLLPDGIHPGDDGHAVIADRLEPECRRALARRGESA